MTTTYFDNIESPIGILEIRASDDGITSVLFVEQAQARKPNAHTEQARSQLIEYFAGERTEFELTLSAEGTQFQKSVWQALSDIAFGKTCSYSDIAQAVNSPKAVRAVGAANGRNPISIIVPCHRVIGSNGTLTGYAGGMERKAWLLKHEGVMLF